MINPVDMALCSEFRGSLVYIAKSVGAFNFFFEVTQACLKLIYLSHNNEYDASTLHDSMIYVSIICAVISCTFTLIWQPSNLGMVTRESTIGNRVCELLLMHMKPDLNVEEVY